MRMFVAAIPPQEVAEALEAFLEPRRDAAPFRFTTADQWHVTLAFLAAVPDRALDDLVERLARAASRRTPIRVAVSGGIAFPHVGKAKVLAAGLTQAEPAGELDRLAAGCRSAAVKAGVVVDGRAFVPHLTLARLGVRPVEVTGWMRVLETFASPGWEIDHVALVASYLHDGPGRRPRYEVMETFPLGD